jgi:hypothetical protein
VQLTCAIENIAVRIEQGYRRHHPGDVPNVGSPDTWVKAAQTLLNAHRLDPAVPADPELFVASLTRGDRDSDPERDLNRPRCVEVYRRRVRRIVRRLRAEMLSELRHVEARLATGSTLEVVLSESSPHLSPLGRYVAARRHGRVDLACLLQSAARRQHRACPLYQQACRGLLPRGSYPGDGLLIDVVGAAGLGRAQSQVPGLN